MGSPLVFVTTSFLSLSNLDITSAMQNAKTFVISLVFLYGLLLNLKMPSFIEVSGLFLHLWHSSFGWCA